MSGLVITGYASLDHVVTLSGDVVFGRTTTISDRPSEAWPRLGGGPAYVAAAARQTYHGPVVPVSWVGADILGETYIRQLKESCISVSGMTMLAEARTPISMLVYNPAGDCACLYDPGIPPDANLSEAQKYIIEAASNVCLTIGPKNVTAAVLDMLREDQFLSWIVKNDPDALSSEQASEIAARADIIFCNAREREFLDKARGGAGVRRKDQWIVETHGQRGALFDCAGKQCFVPAEALSVRDPTGAGDSFAGGVLAAFINGERDPETLGQSGHQAARVLLNKRKSEEETEKGLTL
ncbi:carbohydrate kinase family protein [Rhizobium sp. L1K21]|uniref:carbohydrate kinase family protein n=1 Tax=Rhizobium sp. L1K21 TaxID=2954933 RepID=UPI0020938CEE|nr:carbohydrate kinase family protein [Rhizobium sp. L1K21]MCO6187543.1 carbohydrate kinase family protein [Rhizobium sp. L1K21]